MRPTDNTVIEIFVDHIEASSLERRRWLTRVRTAGFDQALMEFAELLMEPGNSWLIRNGTGQSERLWNPAEHDLISTERLVR